MARVCQVTGKKRMVGNHVSTPSARPSASSTESHKKRIYIPEQNRTVTLKLSARALRTMNKKGVLRYLEENGVKV